MSFKFTFREITPEDTEILRILKLRNAKPEEHICCEILRGDGITMKTWYSKADVALWGEDYIKANSKMKYIDGDWTVSLDVEPWKRTHGVSSKKVTSPSSPRYPTWLTGHVKEWAEKRLPTAKHLGISNGYLCDIEQGRRPAPEGAFVERISSFLELDKQEHEMLLDLAADSRQTVPADLPDYIRQHDIVRAALRVAKEVDATDEEWKAFMEMLQNRQN